MEGVLQEMDYISCDLSPSGGGTEILHPFLEAGTHEPVMNGHGVGEYFCCEPRDEVS